MKLKGISKIESRWYRRLNVLVACFVLGLLWIPLSVIPNIAKEIIRAVKNFDVISLVKRDYGIALNILVRLWRQ